MPDLVEDRDIYPIVVALAGCYEQELRKRGFEDPCFMGVVPEGTPALDFCAACANGTDCPGQAWVRLASGAPYETFPGGGGRILSCALPIAWQLEVGFSHCAPMPESDGTPPSSADQLAAARVQMAAAAAMKAAIRCCLEDADRVYSLGGYQAMNAEGGCLFATWQVTVGA